MKMSQNYYQRLWKGAQNSLKENLDSEEKIKKRGQFQDIDEAKWLIGHLFVNYVQIAHQLDKCYDQMIHPQKRELLGRLLDLTLGRLLELKADLIKIELDNYYFFDNILIELKLTHQDLEIEVPRCFWKDKDKIKAHRKKLINLVFEEAEKEKFRIDYLKNIPEEARDEAWEKYLAKEEQLRQEKEKLEEQQRKLLGGGRAVEMSSLEKLINEIKYSESNQDDKIQEAILMLQRHERARQGRVNASWAEKQKRLKERAAFMKKIEEDVANKAVRVIQTCWRRHRQRLRIKRKQNQMMELLGMIEPSFKDVSGERKLENTERLRRKMREKNQKEFEDAFMIFKDKMTTLYYVQMEEDTIEEIRSWFQWFFEESNYLPDYPPEDLVTPTKEIMGIPKSLGPGFAEKAFPELTDKLDENIPTTALGKALCGLLNLGGSALVTAGHWIGPQEFLTCQKAIEKGIKNGNDKNVKELPKESNKAGKKNKQENQGFQLKRSNCLAPLNKAENDFRVIWRDLDENYNSEQKYNHAMLKDEKCWELSMEIREQVDRMMRLELEILKDALERDKNPKKKRKNKPPKAKKEKKKKEKKDITEHRSLDDLFMELFKNGIIKDYDEVHLKDYIGEKSYCAHEFRQKNEDWPPSPGDVKDVILQLCILPLGSYRLHQLAPLVKSVCLLGTENSGKKFLARIICSETAAVMFDLSPANVVGKYPGKSGLKMLEHLIEKMSRVLQPSVIFVDNTEKTFYKKVPKEEKYLDPKRMAGILRKLIKSIKPTDQILVLGACNQPWLANKKKLLKAYQHLIYIPQFDYASYFSIWHKLLSSRPCVSKNLDTSSLARASNGFPAKAIVEAMHNIFTIQRITMSEFHPFEPAELLEELLRAQPIDESNLDKCLKFYNETELPKKRAKKLQRIREEIEKANKKGKS